MRIGVYSHYFNPELSAPSSRIYDLAQQWLAMDHQVRVVTCFPNYPRGVLYPNYHQRLRMFERIDGIEVCRHWTYIASTKGSLKRNLSHITYIPSVILLDDWRHSRPNVVVGTSGPLFAAVAAAAVAARHHVPFVMEVRDLWPAIFVELGILRNRRLIAMLEWLELALYKRATRIVTVTESFRQNLISRGVPQSKVHTIPNGADVDFWQVVVPPPALREQLGLHDKFVVLYLGTHGISQALSQVLNAARLLQMHPQVHFLFVGDGAEKERLREQSREFSLSNVTFLDPVDRYRARDLYSLANVCLVPLQDVPLFSGFIPSKIFEAMAMERPVIACLRGEAADIVRASSSGLVVPPEDPPTLAEAIQSLAADPDRAVALGKRGREFARARYSRQALARQYLGILDAAISDYSRK